MSLANFSPLPIVKAQIARLVHPLQSCVPRHQTYFSTDKNTPADPMPQVQFPVFPGVLQHRDELFVTESTLSEDSSDAGVSLLNGEVIVHMD
jgi:hypothetical protein